jgi:lysyl-tRNA synthetase class 2
MEEKQVLSSSQEHELRLEKVTRMRQQGIEPWPAVKMVNATCADVIAEFDETKESREYEVSGRVVAVREHGKTAFAHLQDRSGRVQVYIRLDVIGEENFKNFKMFIDIGDTLWVRGKSFKTHTGEVSVRVEELSLQSKSLHPLPEKFHGIADVEIKYRQRYLDLISDPESRERFVNRFKIIKLMRDFFSKQDFLEVETPMLHPIPGGAAARPFVTKHNALNTDLYLRIAPELYLKRLVIGGFERVFEINRSFRNEGISTRHNPEFTMIEFYIAYKDYNFLMHFIETMFMEIAQEINGSPKVPFGAHEIDFTAPFRRLSMRDAVKEYGKLTDEDLSEKNIDATMQRLHAKCETKDASWGQKLNVLFEEVAESHLIQPTFIIDFPIEISPLAKRDPQNPNIATRFELYIGAMETCNGFNELNDPIDQAARFKEQADARTSGDDEAHYYDEDFVLALEHGLPPTAGAGIGVDRLVMLMTNTTSIKDVILFPALKRKE